MTYELAKALKDAGFPQELTDWYYNDDGALMNTQSDWFSGFLEEGHIVAPTLSELIEACGDKLHSLRRGSWKGSPFNGWMASEDRFDSDRHCTEPTEPVGVGPTLEEAVARLWLAIHTPKPEQP